MSNDLNNIDDLFRASLGGYTEVPPPDVWVALEQRLDNKKKKRPFGWYWFIMALLCVGIGGGSLFAWRTLHHGNGGPSADDGSIASVQQAATPATTTGNTSAATGNNDQHTNTNSVHRKHRNHNNTATTTTNTDEPVATAANSAVAVINTPAASGMSNAVNSTPALASAGEPVVNRQDDRANNKAAAIQYIISNKKRNNIAVAESDDDEPAIAGNNTDAGEEDNVTFGKRPTANTNAPEHTTTATRQAQHTYASAAPSGSNRHTRHVASHKNTNAVNFSIVGSNGNAPRPVVGDAPVARNTKPAAPATIANKGTKTTAPAANNSVGTVAITAPVGNTAAPKHTSTVLKQPTATPAVAAAKPAQPAAPTAVNTPVAKADAPAQANKPVVANPATTTASAAPVKVNTKHVARVTKPAAHPAVAAAKPVTTKPVTAARHTTATQPTVAATTTDAVPAKHTSVAEPHTAAKPGSQPAKPTANTVVAKNTTTTGRAKHNNTVAAGAAPAKHAAAKQQTSTAAIAVPPPTAAVEKAPKRAKHSTGTKSAVPAIAAVKKPAKPVVAAKPAKGNKPAITNPAATVAATTPAQPTAVAPALKPANATPAAKPVDSTPVAKPVDSTPVAAAVTAPPTDSVAPKKGWLKGISYGIKGGYEGGMSQNASNKIVISPYIEKQLSSKFSIMAQPAFKLSKVRANNLDGDQKYYSIDPNSKVTVLDSALIPIIQNNQQMGYLVRVNLAYHEKHDSIVKSYATGGSYMEMELPIMVKYAINNKMSVYGGVNLNYSRYVSIKEHTFAQTITVDDTTFTILPAGNPPIRSVLQYAGNNINSYSGPLYPTQSGGIFRMGFMLGVSYEFRKRWMVDALMTKNAAKTNMQGGYDVNKPLSSTYFRFTLGYRLSK